MKRIALFVASIVLSTPCLAEPPSRESIDTLLAVTHADRVVQTSLDAMERIFQQSVAAGIGPRALTPEQKRNIEDVQARTMRVVRQTMSWDRLQPMYEQIYADSYTQDEIDGLIAFYRSPVGASYIDKQAAVLQRSIAASQSLIKQMLEQLKVATDQTVAAIGNADAPTPR